MTKPSKTEELAAVRQLLAVLEPLFHARHTMPIRALQAVLTVAEEEGLSVTEYAKRADVTISTMSRNLIDMSERDRKLNTGGGLVEGREHPENRREKQYYLTAKGRRVIDVIVKAGRRDQ